MNQYIPATLGGVFIGISSLILLLFLGRISGISGIFFQALKPNSDNLWRILFILGLPIGALVYHLPSSTPAPVSNLGFSHAVFAGLLVGFGTNLSGGCTSGHGVCGLARLSKRSLVATFTFMLSAALTVFIMRHVL